MSSSLARVDPAGDLVWSSMFMPEFIFAKVIRLVEPYRLCSFLRTEALRFLVVFKATYFKSFNCTGCQVFRLGASDGVVGLFLVDIYSL